MTGFVRPIMLSACLFTGEPGVETALQPHVALLTPQADVEQQAPPEDAAAELRTSRSEQAAVDRDGTQPDGQVGEQPAAEELQKKRERAGSIGLVLLGLVVGAGVFLLAFTVIWGHRVRRIARHRAGAKSAIDELWYLRHPASDASDVSQEALAAERGETGSGDKAAPERDSEPES